MIHNLPKDTPFVPDSKDWVCTFSDDFDFMDWTKWKYGCALDPKNPAQNGIRRCCFNVHDPDIIFVKDGLLHLRTVWKNGSHGTGWYSAMLETSRNVHPKSAGPGYTGFSQTYGYFEARCKPPKAVGIWSAFWMMPDNAIAFSDADIQNSGEDGIEIDVMESPHQFLPFRRQKNQNLHVLHADGYDERLKTVASPAYYVPQMYDAFHTYGFLWEKDKYTFFVDGHKTWETTHIYNGHAMGICKSPEYLLLSTEVAGFMENQVQYPGKQKNPKTGALENYWCGNPDKNDKSKPYDFLVDWVRCYQRKEDM